MRTSISRHPIVALASLAMALGVLVEATVAIFGIGGAGLSTFTDRDVYTAIELVAVAMCATRALRRRDDRLAWTLMTVGLLSWTAGDLLWSVWLDNLTNPPFPSVADGAYLLMYPVIYAALMLQIRSRLRHASFAQWLDGGVVGLTIAALAAALALSTMLSHPDGRLVAEVVNLAYPCADLILLIFVGVAFSLSNWRPGRAWLLLGAGVVVMAIADIVYFYGVTDGAFLAGAVLDTAWPVSMALFALAAWAPVSRGAHTRVEAPHTIALTLLAAIGALALLVVAAFHSTGALAVGLAAARSTSS